MLCEVFINELAQIKNVFIYRNPYSKYAPIVSFNLRGKHSNIISDLLNNEGFDLRSGLHCAILAHTIIGPYETGTIRFAPSIFNTKSEVLSLTRTIKKIAMNL